MQTAPPRRAVVFDRPPAAPAALSLMAIGAGAVTVVGLALGFLVHGASPVPAEEQALAAVAERRSPPATTFFLAVSTIGDLWLVGVGAVLASLFLWRLSGGRQAVWLLWAALLGSLVITAVIKIVVGRARPYDAVVDTYTGAFPSGHTSRAAALFGLGALAVVALARHPAVRAGFSTLLVGGILLMGFSRVYLGVHWPSDVAYGLVVGGVWLAVLLAAVRPRVVDAERAPPDKPRLAGPG
jgi:membrane-associated phospholipid phosphatase